jgi:hypothetical protein
MERYIDQSLPITPYGEPLLSLLPPSNRYPSKSSPLRRYKKITINGEQVREHIAVFIYGGVKIPKGWQRHHRNGNGLDNRPCNLVALLPRFHSGIHHRTFKLVNGIWYKKCARCYRWFTLDKFDNWIRKRGSKCIGLMHYCKPCRRKDHREYYYAKKMSINTRAAS